MKKAVGMFAALMLALSMTGIAYANWEKIITIEGTITTGTLHLTPSIYAELYQDKPVADLDFGIEGNTAWIDIWDVYPSLWVEGYIDIYNDGSIPAGFYDWSWDTEPELDFVYMGVDDGYDWYDVYEGDALIANLYYYIDGDIDQIDPEDTVYIYWLIHFKEDLPQNATYEFTITFEFWNWNEVP